VDAASAGRKAQGSARRQGQSTCSAPGEEADRRGRHWVTREGVGKHDENKKITVRQRGCVTDGIGG
jgi:hypothetical protein